MDCIRSLRRLPPGEVEIVISDNSDDNSQMQTMLESEFKDMSNINYSHTTDYYSSSGNSERVTNMANGEYCCFIGDDDSVSMKILDVVKYLKKNNLPGCVCDVAYYYWSDMVFVGKPKPVLSFNKNVQTLKILNANDILKAALSFGLQDIKYLLRVYHGVVAKSVLDIIKAKTGTYYPGLSPDMANAVSVIVSVEKYPYINLPLIISGYSYKSTGGMGARNAHTGSLENCKHIDREDIENWTLEIPKIWLGYTVWAEAGCKALQAMGHEDYISQFNISAMLAKTLLKYPENRKLVYDYSKGFRKRCKLYFECLRFMIRWSKEELRKKLNMRKGLKYINNDKISLIEACRITDEYLDSIDYARFFGSDLCISQG